MPRGGRNRFGFDQRTADAQRTGAGAEEFGGRVECHTARGHHPHLRQRSSQRFQVLRAVDIGGKNLDDIGTGLPSLYHFGWRERARHHRFAVAATEFDHFDIGRWRNDEFRTREDRNSGRFRVEDRAGAKQQFVAEFGGDLLQDPYRSGNRERDLHDVDAAGQ